MTPILPTTRSGAPIRAARAGRRPAALSLVAVGVALGLGPSRAAAQPGQPSPDVPTLSLGYADEQGPGQAAIAPRGTDGVTGGTAIELTVAQARGTLCGPGTPCGAGLTARCIP
jgi:hypothetical protein